MKGSRAESAIDSSAKVLGKVGRHLGDGIRWRQWSGGTFSSLLRWWLDL